jgi:hypothetical protein
MTNVYSRAWWWESTPIGHATTTYCLVYLDGIATYASAYGATEVGGVSP